MSTSRPRNFQLDFLAPALSGLSKQQAIRVGMALDAAICFGVLEHAQGNASLGDLAVVEAKYWNVVGRLAGER